MEEGYQQRERDHFDRLVDRDGSTWWGRTTRAGQMRLERRARMARAFLGDLRDRNLLEIGCGTGEFTVHLAKEFTEVNLVACDISPRALELCRSRLGPDHSRVAVEAWDLCAPFPPGRRFDAIVGCSILHHLPLRATLRRCREALVPGGRIWFSEPNMANPQVWVEKNVRWIGARLDNTPDETAYYRAPLMRDLALEGFIEILVRPFDFLHPLIPRALAEPVAGFGRVLEAIPGIREVAGSLEVAARKAEGPDAAA